MIRIRKSWWAGIALALAAAAPAMAQDTPPSPAVLDDIAACAAIPADAERLACYDVAAQSLAAERASGNLVAVDRTQVQELEREAFGLSLNTLPNLVRSALSGITDDDGDGEERDSDGQLDRVTLTIERVAAYEPGKLRFYFENGQVWEQVLAEPVRMPNNPAGATAEIRRASLGSHRMSVNGRRPAIRVRRVQ